MGIDAATYMRLHNLPEAMRLRRQWLLWRVVQKPGMAKPSKMPYYANGHLRGWPLGRPADGRATEDHPQVEQGHELDRSHLMDFETVVRLAQGRGFDGVGFAFLPGDGLIGIDIDGAIDPDTGEVSELCQRVISAAASYTELSPSGKGVHIIVAGETATNKHDSIGLEVFCGRQYFTCTGATWAGMPDQVAPISAEALAMLHATIDRAKEDAKAARDAQRPARKPAPQRAAQPLASGANDFERLNSLGMERLDAWVPALLPAAKMLGGRWRVSSKALGRKLQEDLSLHPDGIFDFGTERGMTPIDVVVEFGGKSAKEALHWLAAQLGVALQGPPRREPPPAGLAEEPAHFAEHSPPPSDDIPPHTPSEGEGAEATAKPPRPKAKKKGEKEPNWDRVNRLCDNFALIYGTDTAWDEETRRVVKVATMRLAFGNDEVRIWLGSPRRRMILVENLVFEPGHDVPDHQINMWDGFEVEPLPCDAAEVAPMLRLLRHLCAISAPTADEVEQVVEWVLRWCALPLQKPGTKMQTALVFHGPQGTGKNLFFDCWRDMFGRHGITVGQTELEDKFNDWLSGKLAIVGDEVVSRQEMYHNKNRLKLVVTQETKFPIRAMQQSVRWESNHANVVFLSNESQPLALEERDRRYMVVYTPTADEPDLYEDVAAFLADDGMAKWMHYLMSYPLDGFNRHTKPLMTEAKAALIELGLRPSQRFVREWLTRLIPLPLQVCSAEQLYRAFRRWAEYAGERFPPPQAQFTNDAKRVVMETVERDGEGRRLDAWLTYKVVSFKDDISGARKSMRVWMPRGTGPAEGVAEGEWAAACVEAFEPVVSRFLRRAVEEQPQ